MPVALPALELIAWLTFAVVLVLAVTIKFWLSPIFGLVNATIGHIPYVGGAIKGGEDTVLRSLNKVISASRAAMTTLLQGVRWSALELAQGVRDFADYVADNWKVLVETAIPGAMGALYASLHSQVRSAINELNNLESTVVADLTVAEKYADTAVSHAIGTVERYADSAVSDLRDWTTSHVHGVYQEVEADIAGAAGAVVSYVDASVAALRHAEDAAVSAARAAAASALDAASSALEDAIGGVRASVVSLEHSLQAEIGGVASSAAADLAAAAAALRNTIDAGVADAEALANSAVSTAQATLESELSHASAAAAADLASAAAALQTAIGQVAAVEQATVAELSSAETAAAGELRDIYGLPTDQLEALLGRLDLTKIVGMGAGLVLLRSLVTSIAAESGLEDATCRAKHKQVCGVDPSEWTDLLAGAAFLTGALSLRELVPVGRAAFHELADLVKQAA